MFDRVLSLDMFGDSPDTQGVPHLIDRFYQGSVALIRNHVLDETAIDFK